MTFIHEGNKTFIDNLVNFEKMVSFFQVKIVVLQSVRFVFSSENLMLIAAFCLTADDSQDGEDCEILQESDIQ